MDLQDILKELEENDRAVIRALLSSIYSKSYIYYMLKGKRKPTEEFETTVRNYLIFKANILSKIKEISISNT